MRSVGKSTHAARSAGAHIRYITRPGAQADVMAERMPGDRNGARSWLDAQEKADRKNARVIDKIMAALPRELDEGQRRDLVRRFAGLVTKDLASWFAAIHQAGKDAHNPHVHLVIRDRDPETGKRVAMLSEKGACERIRQLWEETCNEALKKAGSAAKIDRRSYEAQGVSKAPTRHRGPLRPALDDGEPEAPWQPPRLGMITVQRDQIVLPVAANANAVFGKRLPFFNPFHHSPKFFHLAGDAGLFVQSVHAEGDGRDLCLVRDGLAGEAVEPTLETAGQAEILRMYRENFLPAQNGVVQPQRQFDFPRLGRVRFPVGIVRRHWIEAVALRDFVPDQPCEGLFFPGPVVTADIGNNRGYSKPPNSRRQFAVVSATGPPSHLP